MSRLISKKNSGDNYFIFSKALGDWKSSKENFVSKPKESSKPYVDVDGSGGWKYRKYQNGDIEILKSPKQKSVGNKITKSKDPKAWKAINKEIEASLKNSPSKGSKK